MSRIGKQPITIPQGVMLAQNGSMLEVRGPKGALSLRIPEGIKVAIQPEMVRILPASSSKVLSRLWGLTRALVANMVQGVDRGFEKRLALEGVGYRAQMEGKDLVLSIGFSHPVRVIPLEGVEYMVEKNVVVVRGIDKQAVGDAAAGIRRIRKPEPYKGAGIRYEGEVIRRKAGKKAATAA